MKNSIAAVAALVAALALTSCSSASEAGELLATKSPTQLLRNEAANRLIAGTDDRVGEEQDYSAACKSEADDPEGLYRSWRSTLRAEVPEDSAIGVDQFVGALATSFSEDGWVFTEEHQGAAGKVTTMTHSDSIVTMTFTSNESEGNGASVYIEAIGPCVLTAGPDSDEVKSLES
jgi:hypothetical protein